MRFTIDLWPEATDPREALREAITSIREHGEELSWDVLDDITGEMLAEDVNLSR
jgi:DNA-directed RNA polymerase subunit L